MINDVDAVLRQLEDARHSASAPPRPKELLPWLEVTTPRYSWRARHLLHLQEVLDRVTAGALTKVMIFMPPRHGKTQLATVHYSAYRIERDPELRIIIGAHTQPYANKLSRGSRRIARNWVERDERDSVVEWETTAGGGLRAVGVGTAVAGEGANLIILDDPIASRAEAESAAHRDRVGDWYVDDVSTRAEPAAATILIMTRWHDDDLAGRILASEDGPNWTVISLPAEAEKDDALGRTEGEPLWPERFDSKALAGKKRTLGRSWWSLYQQRPRGAEGDLFKRGWFPIVDAAPKERGRRVRWWDQAATAGGGDYTAGVKLLMVDDVVYVENVVRGQWAPTERDRIIRATAEADGTRCQQWSEQEPGAAGKSAAEAFVRLLRGYTARTKPASGSKELRAEPFAAYAGAGMVRLVRGDWNAPFTNELCDFPTGKHDDQVDAAASAFSVVARASFHDAPPAEMAAGIAAGLAEMHQLSAWRDYRESWEW